MARNADIAFGFFLGSSITSLMWILMQMYYEVLI